MFLLMKKTWVYQPDYLAIYLRLSVEDRLYWTSFNPESKLGLKKKQQHIYQYLDSRFPTVRPETFDCVFQVSANLRHPFYSSQCEFMSALSPLIAVLLRNLKKVRRATNSPRGENELAQYLPNRISCPAAHLEKISSFPHTPPTQFLSWKKDVFYAQDVLMKPL